MNNYLSVLEDSLKKKLNVLARIQEMNQIQAKLLEEEEVNLEAFDRSVDEKSLYIEELTKLDEGFELLYEKLREELLQNKQKYEEQIKRLQDLIAEITERSVSIQAQESRNKDTLTVYFANQRQALGQVKKSNKAVLGYYQNMNHNTEASFVDKKK